MTDFVHREIVVNGLRFHSVEAGSGPLVVLLHGFPEFWYSWRYQMKALAEAGFHVLAPDLRGYNHSDKPLGTSQYCLDLLADDVAGFIRERGDQSAILVGHDWGGAIAWKVASAYPELVERLVILNAPHPAAFKRELRTFTQLRKSWYMLFFQLPYIPGGRISGMELRGDGEILSPRTDPPECLYPRRYCPVQGGDFRTGRAYRGPQLLSG